MVSQIGVERNCRMRERVNVMTAGLVVFGLAVVGLTLTPVANAGGNYLILTPPDYAGSAPLNQFVAAKTALGFTVSTHTVASGTSR